MKNSFSTFYKKSLVTELFDTLTKNQVKWKWNPAYGSWETQIEGPNDRKYEIILTDARIAGMPKENYNVEDFNNKEWEDLRRSGVWHVEFGDITEDSSNPQYDITKTGGTSTPKIFGLIIDVIKKLSDNNSNTFKSFVFTAKEPSRSSMYEKMLPRVAKYVNKNPFVSKNKKAFFLMDK